MLKLSVLDQSPVRSGVTPGDALRETMELAELADRLGYSRYWIAEHHNSPGLASASPEILIGQIAARTQHIRVGSGGVMLTHYAPLKVAEQFRMLETLFPGRIDLGVGRAPGSDTKTARALTGAVPQPGLEHYPEMLMDVYGFLAGDLPPGHPHYGIRAMPAGPTIPELWLLGSSGASGMYASAVGWSFCFAHFITPEGGEQVVERYRQEFAPSPFLDAPRAAVGVSATVADTDEEAEELAYPRWVSRVGLRRGRPFGVLTPQEARQIELTEPELDYVAYQRRTSIYGTPGHVVDRLEELAASYGVDDLVVLTVVHSFEARKRSYELLAAAAGLVPPV